MTSFDWVSGTERGAHSAAPHEILPRSREIDSCARESDSGRGDGSDTQSAEASVSWLKPSRGAEADQRAAGRIEEETPVELEGDGQSRLGEMIMTGE